MSEMPSPILIFGDVYISKNTIIEAKKKYSSLKWITKSATTDSLNEIRMVAGLSSWDESEKVLLVQDLPNKKQVRDFLLNMASDVPLKTKLIVWDSNGHIKIDPKEKTIEKSWADFVSTFRNIKGSKVINNGEALTEKSNEESYAYVVRCFEKHKKQIGSREAKLLMSIVGYDRGMLDSDIKKMLLICPDQVTSQFIIENAFPTTKEAILYKIGNALDSGSLEESINLIERFLSSGTNANQIAEIIVKKARWQMVTAYLWSSGLGWESIPGQLMDMGKFPSSLWHNDQMDSSRKRKEAEPLQLQENMVKYLNRKEGIPLRYFKRTEKSTTKSKTSLSRKNAEVLPMYFMAEQTVNFVKEKIVRACALPIAEIKSKLLNRAITTYLFMQEKLFEIRCGGNPEQDLQEMVKAMVSTDLDNY